MIITIDGPTASGKSTVAHLLAEQLGFMYINSGLLFRAVAYIIHKEHIPLENFKFNRDLQYRYAPAKGAQIWYAKKHITPLLKTPEMDSLASQIATQPAVRQMLLTYQRTLSNNHNIVADGRDCGTVVFPQANYKFYITAKLDVRAHRWQVDQQHKGNYFTLEESKNILTKRDSRDSQRATAPLKIPDDACIIDTTHMTAQEAVETCLSIIKSI